MRSFVAAFWIFAISFLAVAHGFAQEKKRVITTTTILDDMVRNVAGVHVESICLLKPGTDAHNYAPTPADAKAVAGADLVITNGLQFEGWIDKLIENAGYQGTVVAAAKGATLIEEEHDHDEGHDHHHHGDTDPHVWQDLSNGIKMVEAIRDALVKLDAVHAADFKASADLYIAQLRAADGWVKKQFAAVPKASRKLVTSHDAFRYFGKAYGIELKAVAGLSTEQEADAKHIAEVIQYVREQKVKAVFVENVSNPKMLDQIASEAGVTVGGRLFSDSLAERDQPAGTYIGMFRSNVLTILSSMR